MAMTNYMELLMANQPWNLILFMAVPMGLAEAIVASEFFSLYRAKEGSLALKINKCLSIILGAYFTILIIYVAVKILPAIHLRGAADTLALAAYVASALPALVLLLLELDQIIICVFKRCFQTCDELLTDEAHAKKRRPKSRSAASARIF